MVRQSVDELAAEVTKLQAPQQGALDRTSPPSIPARKPVPQTPYGIAIGVARPLGGLAWLAVHHT